MCAPLSLPSLLFLFISMACSCADEAAECIDINSKGADAVGAEAQNLNSCRSSSGGGSSSSRSSTSKTVLLDQIFPDQSLDGAWENRPLLSTPYSQVNGFASIPTVAVPVEQFAGASQQRFSRFQSLFSIPNIIDVLTQPGISHNDDFLVVRKVVRDGEEWMGTLPMDQVPWDEAQRAFDLGGFSVVINAMQRRWKPIADFVRQIRDETGTYYVSMNLYCTPDTYDRTGGRAPGGTDNGHVDRRNAFEYHWDWMDVIVLQISGTKLWSVSRSPTEFLSPRDMKRKPLLEEVHRYLSPVADETSPSNVGKYDDFLLRPGDALYIPRGFIHNASTVSPTIASQYSADDDVSSGPSLHLTVGIEATFESTFEALVHHAVAAWSHDRSVGKAPSSSFCEVRWEILLHLCAGDVARRKCTIGVDEEGCILRRSVPRGKVWGDRIRPAKRGHDDKKAFLLKSIRAIQDHSHLDGVMNMASRVVKAANANGDHKGDYYIPLPDMNNIEEIQCIARGSYRGLEEKNASLKDHWRDVHRFAEDSFNEIMSRFEQHLETQWQNDLQKDDEDLKRVGQIFLN